MNEQNTLVRSNEEAQMKAVEENFKRNSRLDAIREAQRLGTNFGNKNADDLLSDANKIYEWLTKDLQQ